VLTVLDHGLAVSGSAPTPSNAIRHQFSEALHEEACAVRCDRHGRMPGIVHTEFMDTPTRSTSTSPRNREAQA